MASTLSTQISSLQRVGADCTEALSREESKIVDRMRQESIDSRKVQERDIRLATESAKQDIGLAATSGMSTFESTLTNTSVCKVTDLDHIL